MDKDIIALYADGLSICKIAKSLDISKSKVHRTLRRSHIKMRSPGETMSKISAADLEVAVDKYRNGATLKQLAKELGVGYSTLNATFKRHDIPLRKSHDSRYNNYRSDFFESIDNEDKAYIFGFICADGHVNPKFLQIRLQMPDKNHLLTMASKIKNNYCYSEVLPGKTSFGGDVQPNVQINDIKVAADLIGAGTNEIKSGDPSKIDILNDDLFRHFIRGYIDGDGCISSSGNELQVSICCEYRSILEYFHKRLLRLGIVEHCSIYRAAIWYMAISGNNQALSFLKWLYDRCEIFMPRKFNVYAEKINDRAIWCGTASIPNTWARPWWRKEQLDRDWQRVRNYKINGNLAKSASNQAGCSLIKHFHGSFWLSSRGGKSIVNAFDHKEVIEESIAALEKEGSRISYIRLLRQLSHHTSYKYPSIFHAALSAEIISKFARDALVYDPCVGWGGRWLGAIGRCQYYGSEPNRHIVKGLVDISTFIQSPLDLHVLKAENGLPDKRVPDWIFTSPPFGNTEIYYGGDTVPNNILDQILALPARKGYLLHIPVSWIRESFNIIHKFGNEAIVFERSNG
jgi:transposase